MVACEEKAERALESPDYENKPKIVKFAGAERTSSTLTGKVGKQKSGYPIDPGKQDWGKTTLILELMKRAYNEKLFDDIMMAESSQFPDIMRIQDDVAECIELHLICNAWGFHILKGKNLSDEPHGPGKEIKEDSDKVNQPKRFTKAVTRKDLVKSQSMKGKIDLANEKCQTKDNGKDSKKADQGNEKKSGPINEKDDRGKGKKSDDDEKECPEEKSVKLRGQQLRNLKTLLLEYCSLDVSQICQLHKLQVLSFRVIE